MFGFYLRNLPSYGKVFVGITTALMLGVVLWSVFIYYVENGMFDEGERLPLYEQIEQSEPNEVMNTVEEDELHEHLEHNIGLAHVHMNGQTLLFFVLGLLLLFTSNSDKLKKYTLSVFGLVVLTHTIGLSGMGFYSIFDDILSISGVILLLIIPYICFLIFAELFKSPIEK